MTSLEVRKRFLVLCVETAVSLDASVHRTEMVDLISNVENEDDLRFMEQCFKDTHRHIMQTLFKK